MPRRTTSIPRLVQKGHRRSQAVRKTVTCPPTSRVKLLESCRRNPRSSCREPRIFHYTPNETIAVSNSTTSRRRATFRSWLTSAPRSFRARVDVLEVRLIYAGAQEEHRPSGSARGSCRDDLIGKARRHAGRVGLQGHGRRRLDAQHAAGRRLGTSRASVHWLKKQGGLKAMEERNRAKAQKLLRLHRASASTRAVSHRRALRMTCRSRLVQADLDRRSAQRPQGRFSSSRGHLRRGSARLFYNAMSIEGVDALVNFMKDFQAKDA